jgi:hypothetical protein
VESYMRFVKFGVLLAFLFLPPAFYAQTATKMPDAKTQASPLAPPHDISGIWYPGLGGNGNFGQSYPSKEPPPFTAWGEKQFMANKPSSGPREDPTATNDKYLQCDPPGIPRVFFLPRPLEIAYLPGRTLMFFETNNTWREIWTDGRELPKDADAWWYGHSVGKWEDDYTFVVETIGFNDRTWLDSFGHPHSDQLHLTERYHRADHDTLILTLTVDDPKTYTKPWGSEPRTYKLRPTWELEESYCSIDDEQKYFKDVTLPAGETPKPKK